MWRYDGVRWRSVVSFPTSFGSYGWLCMYDRNRHIVIIHHGQFGCVIIFHDAFTPYFSHWALGACSLSHIQLKYTSRSYDLAFPFSEGNRSSNARCIPQPGSRGFFCRWNASVSWFSSPFNPVERVGNQLSYRYSLYALRKFWFVY